MRRSIAIASSLLIVCTLAGRSIVLEADRGVGLEGTWIVRVTPAPVPPYTAIASFSREGVMIATPDPVSPTESSSTGHGVWRRLRGEKGTAFSSTHAGFAYAAPGLVAFSYRIHAQYRLTSPDEFVGSAQLEICAGDSLENCVLQPGVTQLVGTRMR